jgi:IrrE N-terminal-like domain
MDAMAKLMPINGRVLAWAFNDRDLTTSFVADRLSVDEELVQGWIDEDVNPNKGQFDSLVKMLGCTPSFLFLPKPPEASRDTKVSFRRHADAPERIPSETVKAMRTAQTVLRIAKWLVRQAKPHDLDHPSVPRANQDESPEDVADRLRTWLDWSQTEQTGPKATDTSAAKAMRAALQRRRILVLHLTMDEGVTRGFSLHDGDTSLIAVNTRDHEGARFFSYAHELSHLALRDDSVCLTRNTPSPCRASTPADRRKTTDAGTPVARSDADGSPCRAPVGYQLVRRIPRPWDLQFKTVWLIAGARVFVQQVEQPVGPRGELAPLGGGEGVRVTGQQQPQQLGLGGALVVECH